MYKLLNHQDNILNFFEKEEKKKDEIAIVTLNRCLSKVTNIKKRKLFSHIDVKFQEQFHHHHILYLLTMYIEKKSDRCLEIVIKIGIIG